MLGGSYFWVHKQEAGGVAGTRDVDALRPCAARDGREPVLRRRAGKRQSQAALEARERVGENHGTMVIPLQLLDGVGYELEVIALTTSAEMNA